MKLVVNGIETNLVPPVSVGLEFKNYEEARRFLARLERIVRDAVVYPEASVRVRLESDAASRGGR